MITIYVNYKTRYSYNPRQYETLKLNVVIILLVVQF